MSAFSRSNSETPAPVEPNAELSRLMSELIRSYEEAQLDPSVRKDRSRVSALLGDDFIEFGSSGRVWTRDAILDLLEREQIDLSEIEDFVCREISKGVALVTYRLVRIDSVDGRRSATLRSSIWTYESGRWLLRFHQGTRAV